MLITTISNLPAQTSRALSGRERDMNQSMRLGRFTLGMVMQQNVDVDDTSRGREVNYICTDSFVVSCV